MSAVRRKIVLVEYLPRQKLNTVEVFCFVQVLSTVKFWVFIICCVFICHPFNKYISFCAYLPMMSACRKFFSENTEVSNKQRRRGIKKVGERSCNFSTEGYGWVFRISMLLNPTSSLWKIFRPKFCIFGRKFSNRLKFREGAIALFFLILAEICTFLCTLWVPFLALQRYSYPRNFQFCTLTERQYVVYM